MRSGPAGLFLPTMNGKLLESFADTGERERVAGTLSYSERAFESLARESLRRVPGVLPAGTSGPRRGDGGGWERKERLYVHCCGLSELTVAFEAGIAVDGREQITEVAERARRMLAADVYSFTGKRCIVDIRVVDIVL